MGLQIRKWPRTRLQFPALPVPELRVRDAGEGKDDPDRTLQKRHEDKKGAEMAAHCPETGRGRPAPQSHTAFMIKAGSIPIHVVFFFLSLPLATVYFVCLPLNCNSPSSGHHY